MVSKSFLMIIENGIVSSSPLYQEKTLLPDVISGIASYSETSDRELADFLKEAFICISIPVAVFALTYITLDTVIRLFLL